MGTHPTRLYRFHIQGSVSPGILEAIDAADNSRVYLLQVPLEGPDAGNKLAAANSIAADRDCESCTYGSDFYFVARSESESSALAGLLQSRGLGAFTTPEVAVDPLNPPWRKLLLWGVPVALLLLIAVVAGVWLRHRATRQAHVNPPPTQQPVAPDKSHEQAKADLPPGNVMQPADRSTKLLDKSARKSTPGGKKFAVVEKVPPPIHPVLPPDSSKYPPPSPPLQPAPREKSPVAKLEPLPKDPTIPNAQPAPAPPLAPPKISFTADATQLKLGQSTSLHWQVSGASDVRIDPSPGAVAPSGSISIRPLGKTVYTLRASGQGGEANASVNISIAGVAGPASGHLIWTGNISGTQLVTIDHDRADVGAVEGALPGLPCILQPTNEKKVGIVTAPSPTNNYDRLVLRVVGKGAMRIVIDWAVEY